MREPRELIEECKKHLRDTKKYQHEYKTDIRKLITALERALTIPDVVGQSEQFDYIIKPGDEVEVKDFEDKTWFTNEFFVGKTLKGRLVCEDEEGQVSSWDLIRKAPSPKSKAIAEIKKIAEENGITVEIK
jgi:hypothetical protein